MVNRVEMDGGMGKTGEGIKEYTCVLNDVHP